MARLPVDVQRVTPTGGYGKYRIKAKRTHAGLDLGGAKGTPVYAPEALDVVVVLGRDGTKYAPGFRGIGLTGYEPGAVLARGASGVFHVLGHLELSNLPDVGAHIDEGAQVGTISDRRHVHWEVRKPDKKPWPRRTRLDDTLDPIAWLSASRTSSPVRFSDIIDAAEDLTNRVRARAGVANSPSTNSEDAFLWVGLAILIGYGTQRRRRRSAR